MNRSGKQTIRIAILDLYEGRANEGMRCIRQIIREFGERNNLDIISAHTLAWASRNIVFDLVKSKKIKKRPLDIIKKWYKQSYETYIRKAQNFFKHAQQFGDDKKIFDFDEKLTETLLYDAINMYYMLSKKLTNHMKIFNSYYYLKHFDEIENQKILKIVEKKLKLYNWIIPSKLDYYNEMRNKKK